ncbi:MAG TPA: secretin and TonB N-terminal domain-containing protein [Thermoanaerobaculia bacterium]
MRQAALLLALLAAAPAGQAAPVASLGEPITLDVKEADLREVLLRRFAPRTHLNLVVDPDVKGSVTVRLDRVPFERALDAVLASNGWGWRVEGRILRIGKPDNL